MLIHLPNAFADAATNMAIDAALMETVPGKAVAFRHYGWTEPALTFGYSQRYQEVKSTVPEGITLCRRMTGGGMVDHRNDWTYALVVNRGARCAALSSTALYASIHKALMDALLDQDVAAQLAPCPRKCGETTPGQKGPDQCFVQPVMNDVLDRNGRKIAGAAMKRTRQALLIQGSVDRGSLHEALDFNHFSECFLHNLAQSLGLTRDQPDDLRPYFPSRLIESGRDTFASQEWTTRR